MQINPGNLKKKIQIVEYITRKDKDGFEIKEEYIILKTWAQVTNKSGTEIQRSNSDFAEVKTRFLIRTPQVNLKNSMVIKFCGDIYEIVYINDYNFDKKYTEIMAKLVKK